MFEDGCLTVRGRHTYHAQGIEENYWMCPGTELWQGNISLPKCGHESYGEWPGHTTNKHKHKTKQQQQQSLGEG